MHTLSKEEIRKRRAFVPNSALAKRVEFDKEIMYVSLMDGRIIGVPLVWFPTLRMAKPAERERYEIGGGGVSLHWPELDEDLSVAHLLAGADRRST
ncbi:MAG TPA: DUF2442 domain-containing protein [Chloroflexi bacterium]|nr:DUF2442 domain-containing protein [Chloroflexota bacterium]